MKNIWNNNSWFSIVIAMAMTIFIWLTALYILEYIIPFGRNVKGVEDASKSYYQAASGVEDALWFINQNDTGAEYDEMISSTERIDYWYEMTSNGSQIPLLWAWNSEYDNDFNVLSGSLPIQLEIWNGRVSNWGSVDVHIRVPNTTWGSTPYSLDDTVDSIVNWQISSPDNTLNSDGTTITAAEINSSSAISLWSRNGIDLQNNTSRFSDFYNAECTSGISCILKLSIISNLVANENNTSIPYLEYQIDFWSDSVPLRFVQIEAIGKSNGFRKDLNVRVPQLTVDEAFDFTVLQ